MATSKPLTLIRVSTGLKVDSEAIFAPERTSLVRWTRIMSPVVSPRTLVFQSTAWSTSPCLLFATWGSIWGNVVNRWDGLPARMTGTVEGLTELYRECFSICRLPPCSPDFGVIVVDENKWNSLKEYCPKIINDVRKKLVRIMGPSGKPRSDKIVLRGQLLTDPTSRYEQIMQKIADKQILCKRKGLMPRLQG